MLMNMTKLDSLRIQHKLEIKLHHRLLVSLKMFKCDQVESIHQLPLISLPN
jgi:hypothetical protein